MIHDAAGIGRSADHDAAGIGRSMIHHAAGIGRSMIHHAAGIVGSMIHDGGDRGVDDPRRRVGRGATPDEPPHGSGNLWGFERLWGSMGDDRGAVAIRPRHRPDDATSVARPHDGPCRASQGWVSTHPERRDPRTARSPPRRDPRSPDPRRAAHRSARSPPRRGPRSPCSPPRRDPRLCASQHATRSLKIHWRRSSCGSRRSSMCDVL
jgi:hypothetical protein